MVALIRYTLDARVPELERTYERGLPPITRQRLQWASSTYRATALSVRGDLWLYNHLAGGPVAEALELSGFAQVLSSPLPLMASVACGSVRLPPIAAEIFSMASDGL